MDDNRARSQDESLKNNDQPVEGRERQSSSASSNMSGDAALASASLLNGLSGAATDAVRGRHNVENGPDISSTGTMVSYEGATAPGGGGSAGTGEASGQSATGSSITSTSADQAVSGANNPRTQQQAADDEGSHTGEPNPLQKQHDDEMDRDTVGTP